MKAELFDVHTHVQFAAFKDDADSVIRRALDAGVWLVNVGTQADTSAKAIDLAEKYPEGAYATVGLHPLHTEKSHHDAQELGTTEKALEFTSRGEEFDYEYYKKLAVHPKVVAIGECGLDYYRLGEETKEKQMSVFLRQIELAHDVKKPLMIHCRQAFSDLIKMLHATRYTLHDTPSVVHFFSGTRDDAQKLLDMGFYFSFGGVVTFTRDYDEVVKYIPLEQILLETDAPYLAPVPYRGKRNEPAYVIEVAKKMAELKSTSLGEVAMRTTANAKTIFVV
ncbi:MAG: TatD family hydrolase [Candidatus Sungbacteria bacterium]|nr:TatD family hydrolase [Candidatus Sungbacteria bacterium]